MLGLQPPLVNDHSPATGSARPERRSILDPASEPSEHEPGDRGAAKHPRVNATTAHCCLPSGVRLECKLYRLALTLIKAL